jgi:hypothetical protein
MVGVKFFVSRWLIPVGFLKGYTKLQNHFKSLTHNYSVIRSNDKYKDIHVGQRCFILGNGPSVTHQDIAKLKNEIVFSVSSGYLHTDYDKISPQYHCVPQITYTKSVTEDTVFKWFAEMDQHLGEAELFLSVTEFNLVKRYNLFQHRTVHYLNFEGAFESDRLNVIDISRPVPGVQSVPVMCLMIAMYMGFKKIYLVGVDHDSFLTGSYQYAFQPTVLANKDESVKPGGGIMLYEEFKANAALWYQYRCLKNIAMQHGVRIMNASHGGALDEFERIKLDELI